MASKRITVLIVTGALLGMSALAAAQTGTDAQDPAPATSNPASSNPTIHDTVGEGQGTSQYVPGNNRGGAKSIPGEGAGTPPEQHLHKNPKALPTEIPPAPR